MTKIERSVVELALECAGVPLENVWWDVADPATAGGGRWLGFLGSVSDVARVFAELGRFAGEALHAEDPASWEVGVRAREATTALAAALRTPPFPQSRDATLWYFPNVTVVDDHPTSSPDAPRVDVDVELPTRETRASTEDVDAGTTSAGVDDATTRDDVAVDALLALLEPVDVWAARDEERTLGDPDAEYDRRGDR